MATATVQASENVRKAENYKQVLNATDLFVKSFPNVLREDRVALLAEHRWWLREADRHAAHGYYNGGEMPAMQFTNTIYMDGSENDIAQRNLEKLFSRQRLLYLYDKTISAPLPYLTESSVDGKGHLGIPALLNGTYKQIIEHLTEILRDSEVPENSRVVVDVLLPRHIMKMNYPFSSLRGISGLPPRPTDLRVLFDWELDFRNCFDGEYLIGIKYNSKSRTRKVINTDGYRMHRGGGSRVENWVLDLAECNHNLRVFSTMNGTNNRIDFAVRQWNMHKKFWIYKSEFLFEHFGGKFPMTGNPNEVYNAARRAIRRTNSYLQGVAKEFGMEYYTFPPIINP